LKAVKPPLAKGFLGAGWKFPVQITNNSMFATSKFEEDIREAIWIIVATSKGQRVMRPDFGCGIHDFVFETMNSTTISLVEQSGRDALILWEPRIILIEVKGLWFESYYYRIERRFLGHGSWPSVCRMWRMTVEPLT
jgi:uncharacterized protein